MIFFCRFEALKLFSNKPKPTKNVCIKMSSMYYVCVHIQMHFRLDFIMDANTMKIKKSGLVLYFTVDSQYLGSRKSHFIDKWGAISKMKMTLSDISDAFSNKAQWYR